MCSRPWSCVPRASHCRVADAVSLEIISQAGGDPAAVSFDAVTAGKARGKGVVRVHTAGCLPTQFHLMYLEPFSAGEFAQALLS